MIFFFYGPNTYAARRQIAKLMDEYKKKSGSDLGLERIDGAKVKPEELRASLQAAPFLANTRLVIIEDLGTNKPIASDIAKHIKDVPSTTVAVFYDPKVDQRTAYFKTLKEASKAVKFEELDSAKLRQWVSREAASQGAEIEPAAAVRLLEAVGEDQWRLHNEIAKLAAFRSPITAAAVNELVVQGNSETIFNLVESMTAGQVSRALELYRALREEGQNEIYLLSMVIWQLRNLLLAKAAGNITPAQLAKEASMSPFVAGKMMAKRSAFSQQQLKQAFLEAVDTDYKIKSGAGAPDALVEQLVYRVAGAAAGRPSRPA